MIQIFLHVGGGHYSDFDENFRHHRNKSCCSGDLAPTICAHLVDDSIDIVVLIGKCVVFMCQQLCVNICASKC
jgi:hypothetical protein